MTERRDFWDTGLTLESLVERASSPDPFERWAAAIELGRFSGPAAVKTLKGLCGDTDQSVKEAASRALDRIVVESPEARIALATLQSDRIRHIGRRLRTHLDAPPFMHWRVRPVPRPTKDNAWVVDAIVHEIIETEGPMTGLRLWRQYYRGYQLGDDEEGGRISRASVFSSVKRLIQRALVERSDDRSSVDVAEWILHPHGGPSVVVRQRGLRRLDEIPVNEVAEALAHVRGHRRLSALDEDTALEALISFYEAENEMHILGGLLTRNWQSLLTR